MATGLDLFDPLARATVEALLNSLWQGMVLAVVGWCLLRLIRQINATTRYLIWWTVLLGVLCLPLLTSRALSGPWAIARPPMPSELFGVSWTEPSRVGQPLIRDMSDEGPLGRAVAEDNRPDEAIGTVKERANKTVAKASKPHLKTVSLPVQLLPGRWPLFIFGIWLLVAATMMARLVWSYGYVQRLKRRSWPLASDDQHRRERCLNHLGVRRSVSLRCSHAVSTPMMIGLMNPMILIPEALHSRLAEAELDQVILHELAHIRRWDDWTNLGQRLAEAVFFFHPAVLWVGRQLNLEREIACDDWVVSLTGEPRSYAACLTKLVELATGPRPLALAPGVVMAKKQIYRRIEMLLNRKRNATPRLSKVGGLAILGVLIAAVAYCAQMSPGIAVPERPTAFVELTSQVREPSATPQSKKEQQEKGLDPLKEAEKQLAEADRQIAEADRQMAEAQKQFNQPLMAEAQKQIAEAQKQAAEAQKQLDQVLKQKAESLLRRSQAFGFGGEDRKPAIPESELLPVLINIARTDANADVRREAIKAIGQLDSDASLDALLQLYDALGDVELKKEVIAQLGWKRDQAKAIAKLTQIAKTSSDPELRNPAFKQLAWVEGEAGAEALISIYDGSKEAKVKESLIRYLGLNGGKKAVQKLITIAQSDPDPKMRLLAVRRLGNTDGLSWLHHLGEVVPEGVDWKVWWSESPEAPNPPEPEGPPR